MARAARRPAVADIAHFPAPVGGWNAFDSVAQMGPTDAVVLDNIVPETTYCRLRRGSTQYSDINSTSPVRSLMTYGNSLGDRLLAAAGTRLVDVTNPGGGVDVGPGGFTSDLWQSTNFATPGGQFLVMVNGTAHQWYWDGTTLTAATNTFGNGAPANSQFVIVCSYQQRLFFVGVNSQFLYYLPVNVLQGDLHYMDLGSFFTKGGAITEVGTWTRDNGFGGSDDLLCIVSTHGEVLLYQGIDPDTAGGFTLTGRFVIGRPVGGHRALTRFGPDMMLICEDGFQAMSNYLSLGETQALTTAISKKIGNAVTQAIKLNKQGFGWETVLFAANNIIIVNVPQVDGSFVQYVANTITGAWCRFTGLDADCWTVFDDRLFFGSAAGKIVEADGGVTDRGVPIHYELVTAFQVLGGNPHQKRATMCKPYLLATGGANPTMDVNVDYAVEPVTSPIITAQEDTLWNQFNWNQAVWAADETPQADWYGVDGLGNAFAVHMSGNAATTTFQIMAFDLAWEAGTGFI